MKNELSSLLEVNRLDYRLPPALAVANSRSKKAYPALTANMVFGETMIFTLSSGASYLDFLNSYISFNVTITDDVKSPSVRMSPHCGWAQAIKRVTIIHSSGVEIDRINDSNGEFQQLKNYYDRSRAKRRTQGQLYNLNDSFQPGSIIRNTTDNFAEVNAAGFDVQYAFLATASDQTTYIITPPGAANGVTPLVRRDWTVKTRVPGWTNGAVAANTSGFKEDLVTQGVVIPVVIPLSHIHPFFDSDLLAPSFLAAGLRIELEFHTKEHFFQRVTYADDATPPAAVAAAAWDPAAAVRISKPLIQVESFTLTDSIVRKLSQVSAESGLEWYFTAIHQSQITTSQTDNAIQISRALSRANSVIIKTRRNGDVGNALADSFASEPWDLQRTATDTGGAMTANRALNGTMNAFQVQLGAQYIPAATLTDIPWFIHSALMAFSTFRRTDEMVGVSNMEFTGADFVRSYLVANATTADIYAGSLAIAAVPLETSSTLQQSGSPISAQRTAVVNIGYLDAPAAGTIRRIDLFVPYEKLATLFLDSVVVRS